MDWNLGGLVALGIAVVSVIVWTIRLEGEVKMLKQAIFGDKTGLIVTLKEISAKLSSVSDTVIEVRQELKDLRKEHDKVVNRKCKDSGE